jgi:predicted dehydrogenase
MITRETPDQILLHTKLLPSGAPISIHARGGKQFKDTPAVDWRVYGTKGEIRVTSQAPISLSVGGDKIELFDGEKDSVEEVKFVYKDAVKDLPPMAKNIGGLYELFANGGGVKDGLVRFEEAVDMHKILAAMERSNEEKKVIKIDE